MKLAVVGATGLVGTEMLKVLEELDLPFSQLIPVASAKSVGKTLTCKGQEYKVVSVDEALSLKPDVALFSAGGNFSKEVAPQFAALGCYVIDNSSAWRMTEGVPLVVPEVNADALNSDSKIIANPNCSTIQMVAALAPLHRKYGIKRIVVSTYQSFTGTGVQAVNQYEAEKKGDFEGPSAYPHPIYENCIPHCDIFLDNGYTKEEMKLVHETRKILGDQDIQITATAVRVPVHGGHSEAVNLEFNTHYEIIDIFTILNESSGIIVQDDITNNLYPMPLNAKNKNEVFVGRIRRDESIKNGLNLWIVADNLRKGAATNAVQIAHMLLKKGALRKELQTD